MKNIRKFMAVVGCVLALSIVGCSSKEKQQCQEQVENFLIAYQQKDETCGKYLNGEHKKSIQFEGFQATLAQSLKFQVKSVIIEEDCTIVNTTIENVDFGAVVEEMVNDEEMHSETSKDILDELESRLSSKDAARKEFEVEINLDKDGKIQLDGELSNALFGGYQEYIYNLTGGEYE